MEDSSRFLSNFAFQINKYNLKTHHTENTAMHGFQNLSSNKLSFSFFPHKLGGGHLRWPPVFWSHTVLHFGFMSTAASLPFPGKYVMVMGVVQACSPEPCLQAVKMTDLSDNPVHESMWELEVEDLHRSIP